MTKYPGIPAKGAKECLPTESDYLSAFIDEKLSWDTTHKSEDSSGFFNFMEKYVKTLCNKIPKWISVKDRLPEPEKPVLAFFINEYEMKRIIRAFHAPKFTVESSDEDGEYHSTEYCEEKDNYYLKEGWYERNEFDEVNWFVDAEVTHWMELPAAPEENV